MLWLRHADALHQLLHGNFAAAWAMNPLAIAVMPGLAAVIVCGQVAAWRELPGRISRRLGPAWIWSLFFVIVGYGVLRNVPIWPCTLLAPVRIIWPRSVSTPRIHG